jgi:hypothetical protein
MKVYWPATTVVVGAIILTCADFSHYTWWMVGEFFILSMMMCIDKGHLISALFISQNMVVIMGVLCMSIMKCNMLVDTAETLGWVYIPGNFAIHFYLTLHYLIYPSPLKPSQYTTQIITGASLFSAFATVHDATIVYGCAFPRGIMPGLAVIIIIIVFIHPKTRPTVEMFLFYA